MLRTALFLSPVLLINKNGKNGQSELNNMLLFCTGFILLLYCFATAKAIQEQKESSRAEGGYKYDKLNSCSESLKNPSNH